MRRAAVLFVGILGLSSFGVFFVWSNQPSKGTSVNANQDGVEVRGVSTTLENFEANSFFTKVPSNLKMKTKSEIPGQAILGQYLLVDKDPYVSDQLAITVGNAKNPSVSEVSPVQFRNTLPHEYEVVPTDGTFPKGSIVFVKKAGYEKSVFWVEDGRYIGIVASGSSNRAAELEQALHSAITNWSWATD